VHGAIAHLEEIDVAGQAAGRALGHEGDAVFALKLGDRFWREPNRHLDGERGAVVGEHEALKRLVPKAVIPPPSG
jgi:hypothetical protein